MPSITVEELEERALATEKNHEWRDASDLYLMLAYFWKDEREFDKASEYFMRSAITSERAEDWRRIGSIWVECGAALEKRARSPVEDVYDDLESSKHFFPTLDKYAWTRFSHEEKVGRAYRNAAYHLEKAGSNQSAYAQYLKAAEAFVNGGLFAEASRTFYRGLLSFVDAHGEVDDFSLKRLEEVNRKLIETDEETFLKRAQLYYRGLAGRLAFHGNYSDAAKLLCKESEISQAIAWRDKRFVKWAAYGAWKYSSYYGNSFWLWSLWAFVLFVVLFPLILRRPGIIEWQETLRSPNWFDYIFFSLATVTTAPDPSFTLTLVGKIWVLIESVIGFLMLGSLLVLLSKKIMR